MKFGFVAKHRGTWPVNLIREALSVSRSGCYLWLIRPRSQRSLSDEVLGAQVREGSCAETAPKVHIACGMTRLNKATRADCTPLGD